MIVYTVKTDDTLSQIAYKYQTTVAIIMGDNPHVTDKNVIHPNTKLEIRTSEEFAKDKVSSAKSSSSIATATMASASPPSTGMSKSVVIDWEGLTVKENQLGIVSVTKNTSLYTIGADGKLKVSRPLEKNERFRMYGEIAEHGGMYMVGGTYIKKSDASFDAVPEAYKLNTASPGDVTVVHGTTTRKEVQSKMTSEDMVIPQFSLPGYRRLRMQVKKPDGKVLSMEFRAQSFNAGYSNHFSPSRTNEGWAVHVGGRNLTMLQINGFLLDTEANREADDFLINYDANFTPKNSDKYFSSALTTILHKDREYKGLISSLNVSDQADMPLDRKFSMQFMVLSEKSLGGAGITGNTGLTINRGKVDEPTFMSDLKNMLTNPITGKYNSDS